MESSEIQKGRSWGVIHAEWNGATRTGGHKTQYKGSICKRTTSGRKRTGMGRWIRMVSLNIRSGRAGGLETALQVLHQGNIDVGFLQEMKLMQGIHTWNGTEYNVWETEEDSRHQGGVAVV